MPVRCAGGADTGNTCLSDVQINALKTLAGMVRREALVMSFGDVFLVLTFLFVAMAALTPFIKRPRPGGAGADAH